MSLDSEFITRLRKANIELNRRVEFLERESKRKQAKIDALMLEFCPEEMTPQQLAEWGKHQVPENGTDAASVPASKEKS